MKATKKNNKKRANPLESINLMWQLSINKSSAGKNNDYFKVRKYIYILYSLLCASPHIISHDTTLGLI